MNESVYILPLHLSAWGEQGCIAMNKHFFWPIHDFCVNLSEISFYCELQVFCVCNSVLDYEACFTRNFLFKSELDWSLSYRYIILLTWVWSSNIFFITLQSVQLSAWTILYGDIANINKILWEFCTPLWNSSQGFVAVWEMYLKLVLTLETITSCNVKSNLRCSIVLTFHTEHSGIAIILCAKYQTNCITKKQVIGKPNFVRFEFKVNFWYCHIHQEFSEVLVASFREANHQWAVLVPLTAGWIW